MGVGLIWWIVVGLVAGWATGKIMKGSGYGFWADMLLGLLGALVGGYVAGFIGFARSGGLLYTLLIAIAGAVIVVFLFVSSPEDDDMALTLTPPLISTRAAELVFANFFR